MPNSHTTILEAGIGDSPNPWNDDDDDDKILIQDLNIM
jgi:hypothetical protein